MFYYVYVLESVGGSDLYVGFTENLKNRFREHSQGLNRSTKNKAPWRVVYVEACLNKEDALRRERYLKTSQGARLLKRRLKEYLYLAKTTRISTTRYAR